MFKSYNFCGTIQNIKKWFGQGCTAPKMSLEMRLHDPIDQKGTWLVIYQYSDFYMDYMQCYIYNTII